MSGCWKILLDVKNGLVGAWTTSSLMSGVAPREEKSFISKIKAPLFSLLFDGRVTMMDQTKRIEELTKIGLELHQRAETWRQALLEIQKMNNNPIVDIIIKKHLNS